MNALGKNSEVVKVFDDAIGKFTLAEILKLFKENEGAVKGYKVLK